MLKSGTYLINCDQIAYVSTDTATTLGRPGSPSRQVTFGTTIQFQGGANLVIPDPSFAERFSRFASVHVLSEPEAAPPE
jgi:hypothetical protein